LRTVKSAGTLSENVSEVFAMLIVGIDIGKSNHEAAIIDEKGIVRGGKSFRFSNSHDGVSKLLSHISKYNLPNEEVVFGLEATGHYWLSVFSRLTDDGYKIFVINPIQTDSLRNFRIRSTKTDSIDCQLIANAIRIGNFSATQMSDESLLELKELGRLRFYQSSSIGDLKCKVISILDRLFPEYENLFSDVFGTTSMQILLEYSTPEAIASLESNKLIDIMEKLSRKQLGAKKALELQETAKNTFGNKFASEALVFHLRQLLEQIKFIESQIKELDDVIEEKLKSVNTVITSVPGIGSVVGAVIFSEIGDIKRFNCAAKLVAFVGIDPSSKQSGEFEGTHIRMSKRGSPYLRRAIWLAAMNAYKTDPALNKYYKKKREERKHHYTAIGAVCRKLCHIIYAVLRDNKPYQSVLQTPS
jgi:transposase